MRNKVFIFGLLIIISINCSSPTENLKKSQVAHIEGKINMASLLEDLDNKTHLEIGIYDKGSTSLMAFDQVEGSIVQTSPNPDKLFEIGSITKVLTAYIIQSLLSEYSDINIDSKLKSLPLSFSIHPKNEATLKHLINHTSGLPKMPANYVFGMILHPKNPYLYYSENRVKSYYSKRKTSSNLGMSFNYSNFGYGVLGLIASDISDTKYRDLFHKKVSQELGMPNTQLGISENQYSKLYAPGGDGLDCLWSLNQMESEGGAYSTINDMIQFSRLVIEPKSSLSTIKQNLESLEKETLVLNNKESIGQGWRIHTNENTRTLYHEGGSRGYKSFIAVNKKEEKVVILLSKVCVLNKNNGKLKEIGLKLI